jgi:hypothetical protein
VRKKEKEKEKPGVMRDPLGRKIYIGLILNNA